MAYDNDAQQRDYNRHRHIPNECHQRHNRTGRPTGKIIAGDPDERFFTHLTAMNDYPNRSDRKELPVIPAENRDSVISARICRNRHAPSGVGLYSSPHCLNATGNGLSNGMQVKRKIFK